MSKLREMLDAQKKGKLNEQVSKPVLQPETVKAETIPQAEEGRAVGKVSVLDKLRAKIDSISDKGITVQSAVVEQGPIIVEETMPPGLSLMQQMRWKREHVSRPAETTKNSNLEQPGNLSPGITEIRTGNEAKSEGPGATTGSSGSNSESASRAADAQKTNDGVANIEELKKNLAYLANNIENKELVGQVVRTIAMQIANNPELTPHMSRGEVNLMVRGLRMAYQVAAMKKQEKVDSKVSKTKATAELGQMFKDAGIDFEGLNLNLK